MHIGIAAGMQRPAESRRLPMVTFRDEIHAERPFAESCTMAVMHQIIKFALPDGLIFLDGKA
ncbi:hypothetical protein [Sphingobium ummariense]|uniref:Uncharacterized protein n=1 Tax=Sphingobium ummariense RL-3 TaxID=1346791 RepID=T0J420_9SPHN|nr:hypothetical protein [Sphingobium ummariense]EQB31592.1 hypothetical protein M529_13730 [Sphingobium ummariense RL-3]